MADSWTARCPYCDVSCISRKSEQDLREDLRFHIFFEHEDEIGKIDTQKTVVRKITT